MTLHVQLLSHMYTTKLFGALLILSFFLSGSCKKEDNTLPDDECSFSTTLTADETSNRLLGKWEWRHSIHGWTGQPDDEINKGLTLEFKPGGVLIVTRSGAAAQTVSWSIHADLNLTTEPNINETWGPVYFCNNWLLFQGGVTDGANNYYNRK